MAVPSRVSLLNSILRLNLVFGYGIPPEFRGGVHVFILTTINKSPGQSELSGHANNCVPMALTDKNPPAQGQ